MNYPLRMRTDVADAILEKDARTRGRLERGGKNGKHAATMLRLKKARGRLYLCEIP